MKTIKTLFTFFLFTTLFVSCSTSEIVEEEEGNPTNPGGPVSKTTYTKDVQNIISSSCATTNCHDSTNPTAGLSLTNYTQIKNAAENGNLIGRMNSASNPMPPTGRLPQSTRTIIDQWKADGFLEN